MYAKWNGCSEKDLLKTQEGRAEKGRKQGRQLRQKRGYGGNWIVIHTQLLDI